MLTSRKTETEGPQQHPGVQTTSHDVHIQVVKRTCPSQEYPKIAVAEVCSLGPVARKGYPFAWSS